MSTEIDPVEDLYVKMGGTGPLPLPSGIGQVEVEKFPGLVFGFDSFRGRVYVDEKGKGPLLRCFVAGVLDVEYPRREREFRQVTKDMENVYYEGESPLVRQVLIYLIEKMFPE